MSYEKLQMRLRDLLLEADLFVSNLKTLGNIPKVSRWKRTEDGSQQVEIPEFAFVFYEIEKSPLGATSAYNALISTIENDPELFKRFTYHRITYNSSFQSSIHTKIEGFLSEFYNRNYPANTIDPQEFVSLYCLDVAANEQEYEVYATLEGFHSDIELHVFGNIELRQLSDEELDRIQNGARPPDFFEETFALSARFKAPISYSADGPDFLRNPPDHGAETLLVGEMHEILTCLRLFKPGYVDFFSLKKRVRILGVWEELGGTSKINRGNTSHSQNYNLLKAEASALEMLLINFRKINLREKGKVTNSIRWLSQASLKPALQDRFLDYIIVLETLLLEGGQELSYRLKLRAAYYFADTLADRIEIFDTIAAAYGIRSKMVHSGEPAPQLIKISANDVSIENLNKKITALVYRLIKEIVMSGGSCIPKNGREWDLRILGSETKLPKMIT